MKWIWNDHSKLEGLHAFLGASQYHWIGWNAELLEKRYYGQYTQQIGTVIHELAKNCIKNRVKLNDYDKHLIEITLIYNKIPKGAFNAEDILANLLPYVNDAIGFHMEPEVILYHSIYSFGTADTIVFDGKYLRIHDLKTGLTPAHIEQLLIYAALFCLEYKKDPHDFTTELRIYQNFEVLVHQPTAEDIEKFMYLIKTDSDLIKTFLGKDI